MEYITIKTSSFPCLPSIGKLKIIERRDKLNIGQVSALALPPRPSSTNAFKGRSNQINIYMLLS